MGTPVTLLRDYRRDECGNHESDAGEKMETGAAGGKKHAANLFLAQASIVYYDVFGVFRRDKTVLWVNMDDRLFNHRGGAYLCFIV